MQGQTCGRGNYSLQVSKDLLYDVPALHTGHLQHLSLSPSNMVKTYRQNGTMAETGWEGMWAKQP